jgi:hypothetical protein
MSDDIRLYERESAYDELCRSIPIQKWHRLVGTLATIVCGKIVRLKCMSNERGMTSQNILLRPYDLSDEVQRQVQAETRQAQHLECHQRALHAQLLQQIRYAVASES